MPTGLRAHPPPGPPAGALCDGVNARHWQTQCTKMLFKVENPEERHRWHADKEGKTAVLGTGIQDKILTKPAFYNKRSPWFMLMYIHCVLKICNEVVVEGMCSIVAKHAHKTRGLIHDTYIKDRMINYSAPHRAHNTLFTTKALD
jgi:hypothetical protein